MKTWHKFCTGLAAIASMTPSLSAQPPVAPPPTAAPATVVVAERKGFLTQLMDAKANCKKKICDSPFGTFLNNAMLPVSAFSGGMLGPCCPTIPTQADLKAMGLDNP